MDPGSHARLVEVQIRFAGEAPKFLDDFWRIPVGLLPLDAEFFWICRLFIRSIYNFLYGKFAWHLKLLCIKNFACAEPGDFRPCRTVTSVKDLDLEICGYSDLFGLIYNTHICPQYSIFDVKNFFLRKRVNSAYPAYLPFPEKNCTVGEKKI